MDGGHLRTDDGIVLLHFFCEENTFQGCVTFADLYVLFFSVFDSSDQGTYTDTGCTQIVYFVDFQSCIDFTSRIQDRFYFICSNSIQTTAEGVQLNKFDVCLFLYKCCSFIQSGVVSPLVTNDSGSFHIAHMSHAVFCQNSDMETCDQFGDTVIDFRVCVVRSACQNDTCHTFFTDIFQGFFTLFMHIAAEVIPFIPCRFCRIFYFCCCAAFGNEFFCQSFYNSLQIIEGQEGIHESDISFLQIFHIVFDIFVIGCNDRAVIVVICRCAVTSFVNDTRVENCFHALFDEPFYMTMYQFSRVANRFGRDGFHPHFEDHFAGVGRQYHFVAQFCEECMPERIVFIHIQGTGDTDLASCCRLCCQGFIVIEQSVAFVFIQVRCRIFDLIFAQTSFTSVTCDESSAAAEVVDCQQAVVGTALTSCHSGIHFQGVHVFFGYQCCLVTFCIFVFRDQTCAESTHDTSDIGSYGFSAGNQFKAFQYCVVIESAALYNHGFTHCFGIGNFDNLQQCVFDNGICQTSGNIADFRTFLLGLFYTGVHENSTSGAQIDGVLCKQCHFCEILYSIVQGFCESFNKGTAAGGTCFVQQYAVDDIILDADTFHILTADVQNEVNIGFEELCRFVVGNCFNIAQIDHQRFFDEAFTVACYAGVTDDYVFGHHVVHFIQALHDNIQRAAFVACIERIQQFAFIGNQSHFCCSGTCVDTQESIAMIVCQRNTYNFIFVMTVFEYFICFFILEQRVHSCYLCSQFHTVFQSFQQAVKIQFCFAFIGNSCAVCGKQVGIFGDDSCFVCQFQCFDETAAQFGQEVQRAAQECHMATDRLTTSQTCDGLIDYRLEDGCCQVFLFRTFVDQGLDICFCEYAATGSDGIDHFIFFRQFIQTCCICLQQGCHLVDEGTCTAGTDTVHSLFYIAAFEVDDFRVFAAQFDGYICLRSGCFNRVCCGNYFLNEFHADGLCQSNAAGTCDHCGEDSIADFFLRFFQNIFYCFLDFRKVSSVSCKCNFIFFIGQNDFYGCRADVNTHSVCIVMFTILHLSHLHLCFFPYFLWKYLSTSVFGYFYIFPRHRCRHPALSAPECRPALPGSS